MSSDASKDLRPATDASATSPGAVERLATPVQFLRRVGPQRAELLERLGLRSAKDVLFFFPRDYEDHTDRRKITELEEGKLQTVVGTVEEVDLHSTGAGRCILGVLVRGEGGFLRALWFNQPFLLERFQRGQRLLLAGKPKRDGLFWQMAHPRITHLADDEAEPAGQLLPVYPLTEGLQQWQLRRIVRETLDDYAELLEEAFDPAYLEAHRLWPIQKALAEIHFPGNREGLARARRRFVYQELLVLQLALAVKRQRQRLGSRAPVLEATAKIDARIRCLFPFELTDGQKQAIARIGADMGQPVPMNRLLQGDVGCGKTICAVYAMLLAVAHGYQAVLMAPTEILARQHAQTFERMLSTSQVRLAVLTGGVSSGARTETLRRIAAGEADLIIGTQAILQEDVQFLRLGLVVIDEQHKFGVRQRATLKASPKTAEAGCPAARSGHCQSVLESAPKYSGPDPHYLVMTATPIPRTVTMTLFGDLDVSTLTDHPPGRQKVHTYLADPEHRDRWWEFFGKKLREGRQGFVVAPLVDESEQTPVASVESLYESLANGPLEPFDIRLVHGRMDNEEKDAVMEDFRRGQTQVLVCTSVIEVGVDVPNATIMTIEAGERFGLAQLHQLRGRVSRGKFAGYCCVFADIENDEARQRLEGFVSTTDGFRLAEIDFELRGPGELFGTRQHGLPPLRIADLVRDADVVDEARRDAQALVAADPELADPLRARLRRLMLARYGQVLELGDVG